MQTSEHYDLNLIQGSDTFNPLTADRPNFETIDEQMYFNECNGVQNATETKSGSIHQIVRNSPDAPMIRFTASSDFNANDTFTVDGIQVSAFDTANNALTTGAFKTGATVICCLVGTTLTVYTNGGAVAEAEDSEKLGGELPAYYAKQSDMDAVELQAASAATIAQAAQTALNGLKLWTGTQAQYEAIVTKDPTTLYFIIPE